MALTRIDPRPVRVAVKAVSTSTLTLSGPQTVDGVSCVAGDLVGALGQSDNKSAVYMVQSGSWIAVDPLVGMGLEVFAVGGGNAGKLYACTTANPITWGTTSTAFVLKAAAGAAFDPASPGPIGATTPSSVRVTMLSIDGGNLPDPEAGYVNVFADADGTTESRRFGATGGIYSVRGIGQAASAQSRMSVGTVSLADDAFVDIQIDAGGHGTVTAIGATSSASGSFSFAANGATTTNGVTYTLFDTADTDTKLCAYTGGAGVLRIKNRLGSTQKILITIWEGIAT